MFQGATQLNLEGKGRLAIPVRYRDFLFANCAGALILTADVDGCLLLYPQPEWQPICDRLLALSALNPQVRALQRLLIGHCESVQMDATGRILVSPALREYAALDKHVMLVGLGNKFELWDVEKWQAQRVQGLQLIAGVTSLTLAEFVL